MHEVNFGDDVLAHASCHVHVSKCLLTKLSVFYSNDNDDDGDDYANVFDVLSSPTRPLQWYTGSAAFVTLFLRSHRRTQEAMDNLVCSACLLLCILTPLPQSLPTLSHTFLSYKQTPLRRTPVFFRTPRPPLPLCDRSWLSGLVCICIYLFWSPLVSFSIVLSLRRGRLLLQQCHDLLFLLSSFCW